MLVTGLEFHRSFWDIVMLLEGIKHPSMELHTTWIDCEAEDGRRHQIFRMEPKGVPNAALTVSSVYLTEDVEERKKSGHKEFSLSDNVYLMPQFGSHLLPVAIPVPARKAHLSADLIYYWFTLCMGHKAGETKAAIGRKYALDIQKQMKVWLDTLDQFHKYTQLQD